MGSRTAQRKTAPTADAKKNWRPHLWALGAVWAVTLAAYASSFGAGLVFDNRFAILGDSRVQAVTAQNAGLILGHQYWYGNMNSELYRPLTTFSYMFNYAVLGNGPDPAGYHLVNFALHAINIALVYALALWILGELRIAVAMTAIWALHPVLTESVTNIVGRADLLAAFGVLAGLVCHIQAGRAVGPRRARWLLGLALATAVGMFSKESAIAVLGAMAVYDVAFVKPSEWRARAANYAAAMVPCVLFLVARARVLATNPPSPVPFTDNPLAGVDFWTARLTALRVIGKYVGLLLWPGNLSADYSYNQIPAFRAGDWAALAGVAVCLAVAAAAVWSFRRHKAVFFFLTLSFVTLAPVSNVFLLIGTIMAERFLYLPALGFAACAALALRAASRRMPPNAAPAILAVICALYALRGYARNQDWATEQTLMTSTAAAAPNSWRPHTALASLLSGSEAVAEADKSMAILDSVPDAWNSMRPGVAAGTCYRNAGDLVAQRSPEEAQALYRKSLGALLRARAIEQACDRVLQRQLQGRSHGPLSVAWDSLYLELGRTYVKLVQPREAIEALQHGRHISQHPEYFFEEISNAYRAMGDSRQAAIALIQALSMNASQTQVDAATVRAYGTDLSGKLVELYSRTEPESCAVRETRGMRSVDRECPLVKDHICAAMRGLSRDYPIKDMPPGCPAE